MTDLCGTLMNTLKEARAASPDIGCFARILVSLSLYKKCKVSMTHRVTMVTIMGNTLG